MSKTANIFQCVIISPAGKLLDCPAVSAIFTAHDGSVGVLHNHMPMLCELGLGIMEIRPSAEQQENQDNNKEKLALIDGGFALISSNLIKIIASDAVCGWDINREKIEHLLESTQKRLDKMPHSTPQYQHDAKKNALLKKILEAA